MKKAIKPAIILALFFLFSACLKENHSIRFRNNFSLQINQVVIGNAGLGNVAPGAVTDYKPINTGNFSLSGITSKGQPVSGSGSISGVGTHKWTLTLTSAGGWTFEEDK